MCIAAIGALAPSSARAFKPLTLTLRATSGPSPSEPPPPPRWLSPPEVSSPDSPWGVPAAFLKGLLVDRTPLGIGRIDIHGRDFALRVDGQLRLASSDVVFLGGHVDLTLHGRTTHVPLPFVTVQPRQQNGLFYAEVDVVLFDRRF